MELHNKNIIIDGYIVRENLTNELALHLDEPNREWFDFEDGSFEEWDSSSKESLMTDVDIFQNLTYDDEPIKVKLTIEEV